MQETIILPLRRPEIFAQSSLLKSCKGLLLFGPPGTGKTMLAKALARESGANFLSIATSTIFNKYVGDSEQNTRAIFTLAARLSPCVIFIDEIDSLLSSRDQNGSGQEYSRKVKNEFMSSWDGLMTDENLRVVVIGCTNRPFDLDDAVLRRFSRKLLVDLPDAEQREKILKVILRKEKLSNDVDLKEIASDTMTKGFSGSDLYNLCQTAAYMPIREIVAKEENNHSLTSQPKMDSMGLLSLEEEDDKMTVEEEQVQVRALTMKDFIDASKEVICFVLFLCRLPLALKKVMLLFVPFANGMKSMVIMALERRTIFLITSKLYLDSLLIHFCMFGLIQKDYLSLRQYENRG